MNRPTILTALLACVLTLCGCNDNSPEARVHRLLTDRMETLATAESCTGGTIAARFTAMPGASAYFLCGIVAYSLDTKQNMLGVNLDSLARHGAVSEATVRRMAEGIRRMAGCHYGIATTGIAGPTGGTPETPIGTVWIAVSSPTRTVSKVVHASGNRNHIIREAGTEVIEMLEEEILAEGKPQ